MVVIRYSPAAVQSEIPWEALVAIIPHILWSGIIVAILIWIGRDNLLSLLRRVNKVSVAGVEWQFADELKTAADTRGVPWTAEDLGRASRRLANSIDLLRGSRLLWVDDRPEGIVRESKILENAGISITRVQSSEDAFTRLNEQNYDLVLSDIRRGDDTNAGLDFATQLVQRTNAPMLVFYVGTMQRPTPETAFGITNQPDELVHLVLDVMARVRD